MGKRISKEQKEEGVLIKIKAYREDAKQSVLTIWLIAWTLCGLAIISQVFYEQDAEMKKMILIFAAFWVYFEYKVIKIFKWRKSGEEQILITKSKIHYGRTYNNRGFLKPFRKDIANQVRKLESESNSLFKTLSDSYWVAGNPTLAIPIGGKLIHFGLKLESKEQNELIRWINANIEKK